MNPEQNQPTPINPAPATSADPVASAPIQLTVRQPKRNLIVAADSQGNIQGRPAETEEVQLKPFPDGVLFRCSKNGKGQWVLHDAANVVVALVRDQFIADFLCKGAHMAYLAAKMHMEEAKAAQEAAPLDTPPATL